MGRFSKILDEKYDITPSKEKREQSYREYLQTKKDLDREFSRITKLDMTDIKFLMFASVLQTARWVILGGNLGKKIDTSERKKHDDPSIKDETKRKQKEYKDKYFKENDSVKGSEKGYRSAIEIAMTSKVPYDATRNASRFGLNLEGKYHRVHTLGHDPILGYIFGTLNILTDTMTVPSLRTFDINMKGLAIEKETTVLKLFQDGYESIKEDYLRLPAAIFAQALHLESDEFTKAGLPAPILSVFNEELAGKLYKEGYDNLCFQRDLKTVGLQFILARLIDVTIGLVHGLYYDPQKHQSRDLYEVKTRKILLYSNIISSSGNLLYTTLTKDMSYLDIGGFLNTAYRIITDVAFISNVKREFIEKKLYEKYDAEIKALDEEIEKNLKKLNISYDFSRIKTKS